MTVSTHREEESKYNLNKIVPTVINAKDIANTKE
jgi:hypothetical protein